jgi:HK97 family phage major capsid protein
MTNKTPEELVKDINASIDAMKLEGVRINTELQAATKAATSKADTAAEDSVKALKAANESAEKIIAFSASMNEMQQKLAEGVKGGTVAPKTLGEIIVKSEEFAAFAAGKTQKMRIEANTIIGQEGSPPANSGTIVAPDRQPGIIPGAFRNLKVADFLPQGNTTSNLIQYTRELAFTNGAEETAEGDTKKQSAITFELDSAPVVTIAHFIKASKQILDDSPALQSYIDTRMRYGVDLKFEKQLLVGTGVSQQMGGMTKSGNYTAFTPTTGEMQLDSINRMIEQVETADYAPTGIIMNTADWHAIERLKRDTTYMRNAYVVGDPLGSIGRVLWGLPVVVSNSVTPGKAIVAAFDIAFQIFNRMTTIVEMFEQDDTNVQKNLITIRAEKRAALCAYRPASVAYGLLVFGSSH